MIVSDRERCNYTCNATTIDGLTQLPMLERLELRVGNLAGRFPSNFGWFGSPLTTLVLKSTQAVHRFTFDGSIPASFRVLKRLEHLHLENLAISSVEQGAFGGTHALKTLSLVSLQELETDLSISLRFASNSLIHLDLSNSIRITVSMAGVTSLHLLEHLDISGDSALQWFLGYDFWRFLPKLRYFAAPASGIVGSIDQYVSKDLQHLDLSQTIALGPIPPELGLTALTHLDLSQTRINGPIPHELASLNSTLQLLSLTGLNQQSSPQPLPEWLSSFDKLEVLNLGSCNFHGTIPASYGHLPKLTSIALSNNRLNGTIPEVLWPKGFSIDVSSNNLTGTIPASVIQRSNFLYARQNQLQSIPPDAFSRDIGLLEIDLSHNSFSGPLPELSATQPYKFDLSYNEFNGTIPSSYCGLQEARLNNNNLTGSPISLFHSNCTLAATIYLNNNEFSGTFPSIQSLTTLFHLDISNNRFTGDMPNLPTEIHTFYASHNAFELSAAWKNYLPNSKSLAYLDISHNNIASFFAWQSFVTPTLKLLSLAHNRLGTVVSNFNTSATYELSSLDITNTRSNSFNAFYFRNLVDLKIGSNYITSALTVASLPLLSQLDVSNNKFSFDVAAFSELPLLTILNARSNKLYGSLVLNGLPNLISADFSDNNLDWSPDLASIGSSFRNGILQLLNITYNNIPIIQSFDTQHTGLERGESSSPSSNLSLPLTCYELVFYGVNGRSFVYSEGQFNYLQCDCNSTYFGQPPLNCHQCPSSGTSSCGATETTIMNNHYVFLAPSSPSSSSSSSSGSHNPSTSASNFVSLLLASLTSTSSPTVGEPSHKLSNDYRVETEPCLTTSMQSLSGKSNCIGLQITSSHMTSSSSSSSSNDSITHLLSTQCALGSEGRLCSRCVCDVEGDGECWFERGPICSKCSRVFRLSQSLPLVFALMIVLVVMLTAVMVVVLRSRRKQSLTPWKHLSLPRRIFYRLLHITCIGNVSILVTFLQILVAFTNWDVSLSIQFLGVLNGDIERYDIIFLDQ